MDRRLNYLPQAPRDAPPRHLPPPVDNQPPYMRGRANAAAVVFRAFYRRWRIPPRLTQL